MPAQRIYKSSYPDYVIPRESVYTRVLPRDSIYDDSSPAFIDATTGRSLSRGDLRDKTLRLGWSMRNQLNANKGDVVMIYSPNSFEWPITLFGCVAAGLRCTLANSSYTPTELAHQLTDSGAGYVFVHPSLLATLLETFELAKIPAEKTKKRVVLMSLEEKVLEVAGDWTTLASLMKGGKLDEEERYDGAQSNETVYLCYSSGTTGRSKGVETTHHNVNAVLTCCRAVLPRVDPKKDLMLGILPFYHIYGAVKLLHYPLTVGLPVVISSPFTPDSFCSYVQRYRITWSMLVPPVFVLLASHPSIDRYDLSTLRYLTSGAAPLGADLTARVQARLRTRGANVAVIQGYGLTETSPTCVLLPAERADEKAGSTGELLPNMEARLIGADGEDVEVGKAGEFWLRSPSVMKGYLNNPTATNESITADGWFKTGDIAVRDKDGYYWIVDRLKELIKYKGYQVPPADLENVLLTHPDIIDAGVIGIYSEEQATELPRAYVVHRSGPSLSPSQREAFAKDVKAWIRSKVASHKYLRGGVAVADVIPKSAAGKILRRELRDLAKTKAAEAGVKAKL